MLILKVTDRVKFGKTTGTIVGHGTMKSPGGSAVLTYAVRLDGEFRGYIGKTGNYVSTLLVCADGVTKI